MSDKQTITPAEHEYRKNQALQDSYSTVFSGRDGQAVLHHILKDLGLFSATLEGEAACARRNYAMTLIARVVRNEGGIEGAIVNSIVGYSPKPKPIM